MPGQWTYKRIRLVSLNSTSSFKEVASSWQLAPNCVFYCNLATVAPSPLLFLLLSFRASHRRGLRRIVRPCLLQRLHVAPLRALHSSVHLQVKIWLPARGQHDDCFHFRTAESALGAPSPPTATLIGPPVLLLSTQVLPSAALKSPYITRYRHALNPEYTIDHADNLCSCNVAFFSSTQCRARHIQYQPQLHKYGFYGIWVFIVSTTSCQHTLFCSLWLKSFKHDQITIKVVPGKPSSILLLPNVIHTMRVELHGNFSCSNTKPHNACESRQPARSWNILLANSCMSTDDYYSYDNRTISEADLQLWFGEAPSTWTKTSATDSSCMRLLLHHGHFHHHRVCATRSWFATLLLLFWILLEEPWRYSSSRYTYPRTYRVESHLEHPDEHAPLAYTRNHSWTRHLYDKNRSCKTLWQSTPTTNRFLALNNIGESVKAVVVPVDNHPLPRFHQQTIKPPTRPQKRSPGYRSLPTTTHSHYTHQRTKTCRDRWRFDSQCCIFPQDKKVTALKHTLRQPPCARDADAYCGVSSLHVQVQEVHRWVTFDIAVGLHHQVLLGCSCLCPGHTHIRFVRNYLHQTHYNPLSETSQNV